MHPSLPSVTAMAVAAFRGAADAPDGGPLDPVAARLLPRAVAWWVPVLRLGRRVPLVGAAVELGLVGLPGHVELRTLGIDRALRDALARGCRQVVILGAGLDARAVRMPELRGVPVWEVDHPDTQRLKRARLPEAAVRWVPVDFARDDLAVALARAGHDATSPTVWIWEGVTPYLPAAVTDATLDIVAARSAPGSRLLVTYGLPELATLPRVARPLGHAGFHLLGEPLRGLVPTAVFHARLAARGFTVEQDVGGRELAVALGRRPPRLVVGERLVVARCG